MDPEIDFLRAVEDLFATLRGVPHLLSPKDVQLARTWWKDEVPLAAVTAGVTEVMEKKRAGGDADVVVSLSYCRHAVRRHAKRIAELRTGASTGPGPSDPALTRAALEALASDLRGAATGPRRPEVGDVLERFADQILLLDPAEPALVDEQLFALESSLLEACARALPNAVLDPIKEKASTAAASAGASEAEAARTRQAVMDREIRVLLDLPRLEIQ